MFMAKGFAFLLFIGLASGCEAPYDFIPAPANPYPAPTPYVLNIPPNLPGAELPADNPMTLEGIALGRRLFYDPILSGDSSQSCSSCHAQSFGFSDNNKQFSTGIDGLEGNMNAMTIINPFYDALFFWDGRAPSLEEQAGMPVENPIEMHETWENNLVKLKNHPMYPVWFGQAFGDEEITKDRAIKAIAQFEKTFLSANSKYDKFIRHEVGGDFTEQEFNGYVIFFSEKGDCFHCHSAGLLTDNLFHNNGLDSLLTEDNRGLYGTTDNPADWGKFKTPTLRNIEVSGPYMHDGRFASLEEVIDFYSEGPFHNPTVDPLIIKEPHSNGLNLTAQEKSDLLAFLKTLTDDDFLNNPELASPW